MRKWINLLIILSLPALVFSQPIKGKVTHVKDGDSFMLLANGKSIEVRLNGVDCPEKGQSFSAKAKEFTTSMIHNKWITVRIKGYDKYKRALGIVFISDDVILNEELLKMGYAWHFKKYNNQQNLSLLEAEAKKKKIGLWDDPNPIPPWEYRKIRGTKYQLHPN